MNYNYLTARLRARKADIFHKKDYEYLLSAKDPGEMLDYMRSTAYGVYIDAASTRYNDPVLVLTYAIRQHLIKLFQFIWREKPKGEDDVFKFLFSKWEISNLKIILRGIHKGLHSEAFKDKFLPAGEFTERRLNDLSNQRDMESVAGYLISAASPYGRGLEQSLDHYRRTGHFRDLEIDMDRFIFFYFQNRFSRFKESGRCAQSLLRIQVDITNILTLLKNIAEVQIDEQHTPIKLKTREEQFIEGGGRLRKDKFMELLKLSSLDTVLKKLTDVLRDPKYNEFLLDADPGDMVLTEERFEDFLEKYIFRNTLRNPHGFNFIASFLYMKTREVKNLRFILSGIKYKLNREEIHAHLFYPLINPTEISA